MSDQRPSWKEVQIARLNELVAEVEDLLIEQNDGCSASVEIGDSAALEWHRYNGVWELTYTVEVECEGTSRTIRVRDANLWIKMNAAKHFPALIDAVMKARKEGPNAGVVADAVQKGTEALEVLRGQSDRPLAPSRKCPHCDGVFYRLARHIKTMHEGGALGGQ